LKTVLQTARTTSALARSIREGFRQGLHSFYALLKVMAPVYIGIALLRELKILGLLAGIFAPFMKYFGLPGEAALVIVSGWTVNLYAAIAALAGLGFSARDVTILAIMLGISHSLFMETAIVSQMKARPWLILLERVFVSLAAGLLVNLVLPKTL